MNVVAILSQTKRLHSIHIAPQSLDVMPRYILLDILANYEKNGSHQIFICCNIEMNIKFLLININWNVLSSNWAKENFIKLNF